MPRSLIYQGVLLTMNGPKTEDVELDQFDLLNPANDEGRFTALPETNLAATTAAFNTRIQRKKKEQEKSLSEADRLSRQRHSFMIQALMQIRKSLRDVTRIDLGERFHFTLAADDWQGWPRLTVKLSDTLLPEQDYPFLRVTAHDRHAKGAIEIEHDPAQPTEVISLANEIDLKRMPNALKKCVRAFLDLTGDIVLEAERKTEEIIAENALKHKNVDAFEESTKKEALSPLDGDVFQDDVGGDDFLETLPSLDKVESLPDTAARRPEGKRKAAR
ncbi:MAG: hypothetical protein U0136_09730 [Bdellovibrionota bacterium]